MKLLKIIFVFLILILLVEIGFLIFINTSQKQIFQPKEKAPQSEELINLKITEDMDKSTACSSNFMKEINKVIADKNNKYQTVYLVEEINGIIGNLQKNEMAYALRIDNVKKEKIMGFIVPFHQLSNYKVFKRFGEENKPISFDEIRIGDRVKVFVWQNLKNSEESKPLEIIIY